MTSRSLAPRVQSAGRVFAKALIAFIFFTVALALWVGVRGFLAFQHLEHVQASAGDMTSALSSNRAGAGLILEQIANDATAAHELTSDPGWRIAELFPWVGPQLSAFGTVAASGDELLGQGIVPLVAAAQGTSMDALKPVDGRIETSALADLAVPAQQAAERASHAANALSEIDRKPLVGRIASAVDETSGYFSQAAQALDTLSRATRLLPSALGQDGPRNYLVLVENNAEWRSLGGIVGTGILLHTDRGAVSLAGTQSGTAISSGLTTPVAELPDEFKAVYGERPARYFQNLTQIPDFTFDGPLAREMYRVRTGLDVDGVLTIDPVVLSYLLKATGPVTLPDGSSITAENAVQLLLVDVYSRYLEPADQDIFFAQASSAVFNAFFDGRGSTLPLLSALAAAADERRVLLWSANPEEQALLAGSSLAGELPTTDARTARFGVYLNDAGGSKMSYYVKPDVSLVWEQCQPNGEDGPRQLALEVDLTNTAPLDAATSLPLFVTGNGAFGKVPGTATVVSNIYLPEGYELVSATSSDGSGYAIASVRGREVLTYGLNLAPQTTVSARVLVSARSAATDAEAQVTPTADSALSPTARSSCTTAEALAVR
ncbi:DUF4012 domain-containing protein [Microbacterium testaceum]|uniref:DUF4012 domain-containing protein n=1 Tax=Microbacterium testaceum TaxID=2033 RepID=UPI0009BE3DC6|nr:DUF4012 domain-containing protein [Microbacterium testaceum]